MFEVSDDQTYKPAGVNATLEIIRAWTSAVPKGKLLLLDLWADSTPLWNISRSFFGADYIWCMCAAQPGPWLLLLFQDAEGCRCGRLHNFGGTDGMWGDFTQIANGPPIARRASAGGLVGTGLTMEGTNQNWPVYELMLGNAHRSETMTEEQIDGWLRSYAERRYGTAEATDAWKHFRRTAYATGLHSQMGHEPGLGYHAVDSIGGPHDDTYDPLHNASFAHPFLLAAFHSKFRRMAAICVSPVPWAAFDEPVMIFICRLLLTKTQTETNASKRPERSILRPQVLLGGQRHDIQKAVVQPERFRGWVGRVAARCSEDGAAAGSGAAARPR